MKRLLSPVVFALVLLLGLAPGLSCSRDGVSTGSTRPSGDLIVFHAGSLSVPFSVGEFELVPRMLRKNGFNLLFKKVTTEPGMPTIFGVSKEAFVFGLPGNPVSTLVLFETLVKPFLYKIMGHDFRPRNIVTPLERTIRRKKTERMSWIPVAFTESGGVFPTEYHGSAHVHSLCFTDGLISIPVGVAEIKEGTNIHVRQI